MYTKISAMLLLICICMPAYAKGSKEKVTLTGVVSEHGSGIPVPGATIYIPELKTGAITKADGSFQIKNLPLKSVLIQVSLLGYKTQLVTIDLSASSNKDFSLEIAEKEIHEIVVTGSANMIERNRTPTSVVIVSKNTLLENSPANIIEGMANLPGISHISSGGMISKPVIRGLGYNRVVVVNDGIRQEGQQWGDEHGIEIDDNSIEKIEILKGPASLSYGSDALAGVINFLGPTVPPEGKHGGKMMMRYHSNNGMFGYTLNTFGNRNGWIYDARISGKNAHDYKNSVDGYVFNSRFKEYAFSAMTGINRSWGFMHLHLSTINQQPGMIEGLRDSISGNFLREVKVNDSTTMSEAVTGSLLKKYETEFPYQEIDHHKIVLNNSFIIGKNTLKAILGYQMNTRKEYADVLNPGTVDIGMKLHTVNYDFRWVLPERKGIKLTSGLNGMYQKSLNTGEEFIIPSYNLIDGGLFVIAGKNSGKFDLSGGVRIDHRSVNAESLFLDADDNPVDENTPGSTVKFMGFEKSFTGVSGSAGAAWQFSKAGYTKWNIAAGFRSPNISELSANGIHEGTFRYEYGNTSLSVEKSIQSDIAFGINTNHVTLELDLFESRINDFIFLSAVSTASGGDSLVDDARLYTYRSGNAILRGGEFLIDIHPHPFDWIHFENSVSLVSSFLKDQPDSTKHIPFTPPVKLSTEVRLNTKKLFNSLLNPYFKIGVLNYLRQDKIYSADRTETETAAYTIINIGLGTEFSLKKDRTLSFHASISNVTDKAYQSHLSRLKYADVNPVTGRTGVFNEGRSVNFRVGFAF